MDTNRLPRPWRRGGSWGACWAGGAERGAGAGGPDAGRGSGADCPPWTGGAERGVGAGGPDAGRGSGAAGGCPDRGGWAGPGRAPCPGAGRAAGVPAGGLDTGAAGRRDPVVGSAERRRPALLCGAGADSSPSSPGPRSAWESRALRRSASQPSSSVGSASRSPWPRRLPRPGCC